MKKFKLVAIAFIAVLSTATASAQSKKVDVSKSTINWVGKKVTGQHNGTVELKEGALVFKSNKLIGGNFTANMTSIAATDLKAGEGKEKLEGHLNSEDFFGTEKYPTATLVFKTVKPQANNSYAVTADLTIKGKTNPVAFNLAVKENTAVTAFKVDRTKYDIKYGSGSFFDNLGDKTISDDFEVNVILVF